MRESNKEMDDTITKSFDSSKNLTKNHNINSFDTDTIDDLMMKICTHRSIIVVVFSVIYFCSLLYTYHAQGIKGTLLNILLIAIQMFLNRRNIKSTMQLDSSKADESEKQRIVISLMVLTVRYFVFPKNKITFIPSTFVWFIGANKLFDEHNNFWGLLPTYYLTFLYGGMGMLLSFREFMSNGCSDFFVDSFCEAASLTSCIWVFTYYRVNVTGYLKQKVEVLEETSKKLESALEAKNTFMAHISHEFRCPLLSSLGSLELLKETYLNVKQNELVDMILSSNNILLMLIEEILQLMKIEYDSRKTQSESNPNNLKKFNLGACLNSLNHIVTGYSNYFSVNLKFDYKNVESIVIESNPSSLHQILSNLLTNAVKASKNDDSVELSARIIETTTDETLGKISKIEFKVKDQGYGIPESKLSEIFEPFVQLHNVNESHVPSSGLGLTTVLQLINQLKGSINVESQLGHGSTFTVIIPFRVIDDCQTDYSDWDNGGTKMNFSVQQKYLSLISTVHDDNHSDKPSIDSKSKIIIAEDNIINRKVILKLIESIGYTADFVSNGQELVNNFDVSHHKLVITDLNMPILDGIEAAKQLKKKYGSETKIILLTGNSAINFESLKGIVDGILEKPCSKEDLRECISIYCK